MSQNDKQTFEVWVTKKSLSKGLLKRAVEQSKESPGMVSVPSNGWGEYYHGEGRDWHRTLEGAQKKAEQMRQAKIKSLEKQLAKLKAMKFTE